MIFLIVALILFSPASTRPERGSYFVIWNVGQGLWTTAIREGECLHFDAGGEFLPMRGIRRFCERAHNEVFISHADLDHISGLANLPRMASDLCLYRTPRPGTKPLSARKSAIFEALSLCPSVSPEVTELNDRDFGRRKKSSNDLSRIYVFRNFLIPGDSTAREERNWVAEVRAPIKVLVLGHHGSRTSTSEELLRRLPGLKMAVASARFKKYKHPHSETAEKLKAHGVGLLRTEIWGHIFFEM